MSRLPKIGAPNSSELAWIAQQVAEAGVFVEAFSPSDAGKPVGLESLDRAWAAWIGTNPTEGAETNKVINCVGMSFGSLLAGETRLLWVVAADEYGTELALHGKTGDILVYPANFVAKRWERHEINFLKDACCQIIAEIKELEPIIVPQKTKSRLPASFLAASSICG